MTLLNKVKDDVSKKYGCQSFSDDVYTVHRFEDYTSAVNFINMIIDESMQEYAKILCEKQREVCAENVYVSLRTYEKNGEYKDDFFGEEVYIDNFNYIVGNKDSILNAPLPNELKE